MRVGIDGGGVDDRVVLEDGLGAIVLGGQPFQGLERSFGLGKDRVSEEALGVLHEGLKRRVLYRRAEHGVELVCELGKSVREALLPSLERLWKARGERGVIQGQPVDPLLLVGFECFVDALQVGDVVERSRTFTRSKNAFTLPAASSASANVRTIAPGLTGVSRNTAAGWESGSCRCSRP